MKYRDTLYANYHTTQSGRAALTDAKSLFEREKWRFEKEILPLINLPKSARILDIGCGSGSFLKALAEKGYSQITGIDLSEEQVKLAHQLGVIQVQQGDLVEFLNTADHKFDLISGMDIIEHFTKNELVDLLRLIQNHLNPGGLAIFRTPNLDAPMATVYANGDFTHENYMNASSAQQVLMACGFEQVQVFESNMQIPNALKEIIRKGVFFFLKFRFKLTLFATGRSTQNVLISPNMVIIAKNHG